MKTPANPYCSFNRECKDQVALEKYIGCRYEKECIHGATTKSEVIRIQKEREIAIYGKTKGAFSSELRGALRQIWKKSKGRMDALKRSRIPCNDGSRRKWLEACEKCGVAHPIGHQEFYIKKDGKPSAKPRKALVVHHITEVPAIDHPQFVRFLFCLQHKNPADGYMVLCHNCHHEIHHGGGE